MGNSVEESRESTSQEAIIDQMANEGYSHIEVYEVFERIGTLGQMNPRDLSVFCHQLSLVIKSDITLYEGLGVLIDQTDDKKLKVVLGKVRYDMENGRPFYQAMMKYKGYFPSYLLQMIRIGETSGTLDTVLERMGLYYEKESRTKRKIRSAISYPAVLTVLMVAVIILLIVKVLPIFEDVLKSVGGSMPGITQGMMGFSNFVVNNLLIIVGVIAVIVAVVLIWRRSAKGGISYDSFQYRLPWRRMVISRVTTARVAQSLSILIASGVSLVSAMEMVETLIDNRFLKEKFITARRYVDEGGSLSAGLEKCGIFPRLFTHMVAVGENTGRLDDMLSRSSDIFEDDLDRTLDKLTAALEPALIIVLSIIVGIILISVMLPMINIMNSIG